MIYLKCVLAGLVGLAVSAVAIIFAAVVVLAVWNWVRTGDEYAFVGVPIGSPFVWGLALLIFGVAFYWEYRKLSR
jgi:hypothetical protein